MQDELKEITLLVDDIHRRQQLMDVEIVALGDRLSKAVDKLLQQPDLTDEMSSELQQLVASMQLAILGLQGKEVH